MCYENIKRVKINFLLNGLVSARCLPQTSFMRKKRRRNEENYG